MMQKTQSSMEEKYFSPLLPVHNSYDLLFMKAIKKYTLGGLSRDDVEHERCLFGDSEFHR